MKQNCLFICSPSLGLLDNWIPVLTKLKKHKIKLDIFFPKINTVEQLQTSNFLSKEAFKIFNNVIYQDHFGDLYVSKFNKSFVKNISLNKFLKKTKSKIMNFINQEAFFGDGIFYKLNNIIIKLKYNYKKVDLNIFSNYNFICYDIYEENKIYIRKFEKIFKKIKKFSLHHGSDFPVRHKSISKIKVENVFPISFSSSKFEEQYYKNTYEFKNKPKILGCPKHDEKWVKTLKNQNITFPFKEKYILLISRNVDNNYLPPDRKRQYLKIIKKNIIDKNYKLVVKLHPKEDTETGKNFYFKVFKKQNFKKKWKFSKEMPLQLSTKAIFVVTFFSGVAVDMCSQKKTTIELLNLKGLERKAEKSDIFYEKSTKEPIFRVRKMGFVLGASDENQFKSKVNWVINNEKKSNDNFYKHFTKLYSRHRNASQNIYKFIIKNI